ncbi:archaeal ATPase [Galdieria sulphuraria]|uniref:Archaeal ATPase n=1 Tax=Galdieria sulphuraria TaxID=130081 RepID=M2XG76_GALSU|nr:archaeal ATPase [Galdieria sulphuraria]EME29047.1 archaeal ATPase [Galdieria sulphuraria]|eukprot:XP_005705567.1 archaeal ATPase [Galdieria sulphuraria]
MASQEIRISLPGMTKVPVIDRKEDIYSILQTYYHQFPPVEKNFNIRPSASFSPQIFGAGKSCVGQNFLQFLKKFAEEEKEQTKTEVFNKSSSGKVDLKIFSWKHFAENTLSVVLELEDGFSDAPFPRFLQALLYNIILNAYRQNGRRKDAAHVASMIIRELNLDDAIDYLLEQFQKRYLFLMIDELSHLSYLTKYYSELTTKQFVESDPKYVPFRNFFRILRDLLITGKLIVYLAGRTAEISAPLSDARSSSVSLHMLRLNPFNLHDINEYIELATYDGKSLKDWLLPSDDLRHRFVELLKKKTGGIPLIVRNTLLALVEKVANLSQPVINDENMEILLDSVFSSLLLESVTFIIPEILDSATLLRYQFVLLNYQLGTVFPIDFVITLCGTRSYLMDLVATFGFYFEICETDGIDLGTEFKIGCCEFILRAHSKDNFFLEATELLPLSPFSYIPDTSTAKRVFFEFIFMKIFRFRLLTFLHSNSSQIVHSAIPGIFQGSVIEQDNVSFSMESTKSNDIPILRNVSDSFSDHYRKYLQRCGIFVPKDGNSSGADAYVVFHNGETRYVVGFSFKFYHKSEFSKTNIEKEAKKFFKGVVSVLNDESFSSVQLRFQFVVVCTRYDQSVGFSTEEHNTVEDASYLVTEHSSRSTLNESSRSCLQLVIVSQRNLERFFGRENFEILRKIGKASPEEFSKDFSVWCKTVFESMSNEYVSSLEAEQSNVISRVAQHMGRRINEENRMQMEGFQSAMQVEEEKTRGKQKAAASSSSSFDWNTFLREYCGFTEASFIERYARQLRVFSPKTFPYLDDSTLLTFGIALQDIPLIVDGIHEFLEQQSMNVDLVER